MFYANQRCEIHQIVVFFCFLQNNFINKQVYIQTLQTCAQQEVTKDKGTVNLNKQPYK